MRRKLWVSLITFCAICLIFINYSSKSSVPTRAFKKNSHYKSMSNQVGSVQNGEEKQQVDVVELPADSLDETDILQFRGDVKTPNVNIEVNGHSIRFENVTLKLVPEKIRIHFIFHSHVDPGWLETFEGYYSSKVKHIISNAVESLKLHKDLRFIWSETSFLERWWRDASPQEKELIKEQVKSGQLEISGGAWVMTDEATPTFYSAIENLIEGHKFIHEQFSVTPNTSWFVAFIPLHFRSVDPFGHSAMMPELLYRAGVKTMIIGRFHEHIKERLREMRTMRWQWVSPYSEVVEGPRVNSLPQLVYTTEDACQNHEICMCYHVGPSALYQSRCRDSSTLLSNINENNTEFITKRLLQELRKSQKLYGEMDLLVPIGDDFYFGDIKDWQEMYKGYSAMISWLKKHPELNAEMRFSTVSDFFNSIKEERLSTLRGDFFPYTSNMNNPHPWWTGYFVHRPFTKTMERRLQNQLRTLDIVTMLTEVGNLTDITDAKRHLALFQHHDGITGTSKIKVMADYEQRMQRAFGTFSKLFLKLMSGGKGQLVFNAADNTLPLQRISEKEIKYLTVISSQTFAHDELIRTKTDREVKVTDSEGKEVQIQMKSLGDNQFEVQFLASVKPLTTTVFALQSVQRAKHLGDSTKCWNFDAKTGQIGSLILGDQNIPFNLSLVEMMDSGGAYVFQGNAQSMKISPSVSKNTSEAFETLELSGYPSTNLTMKLTCLKEGDILLEMTTGQKMGTTLSLMIHSAIEHESFFTDVNGLYPLERKYAQTFKSKDIPIEANIFPASTSVFIQDKKYRLTVLTGQPTGATSQRKGLLHILVDRLVAADDGKGLGYNEALDTRSSSTRYRLILEKRVESSSTYSFLSLKTEQTVSQLLYPPIAIVSDEPLVNNLKKGPESWPCGIQLVSWRPLTNNVSAVILRKYNVDDSVEEEDCQQKSLNTLFDYFSEEYKLFVHSKLSVTTDGEKVTLNTFKASLSAPFSIAAFRLHS